MILSHPQTPERCPCKAGTVPSSAGSKNRDRDEAESNPSPTVPLSNPPETQVNHSKGVSTPLEPEEGSEGSRGQRAELEGDFQYPASLRLNSNSPPPSTPHSHTCTLSQIQFRSVQISTTCPEILHKTHSKHFACFYVIDGFNG